SVSSRWASSATCNTSFWLIFTMRNSSKMFLKGPTNSGAVFLKAQPVGGAAEGFDTEGDVLLERHTQLLSPLEHVLAMDAASKGLVLQFAFDGVGIDLKDALAGLDQGARHQEASQLVAGEQRALQWRRAHHAGVVGVGEDGADHLLWVAALAKNLRPRRRVPF